MPGAAAAAMPHNRAPKIEPASEPVKSLAEPGVAEALFASPTEASQYFRAMDNQAPPEAIGSFSRLEEEDALGTNFFQGGVRGLNDENIRLCAQRAAVLVRNSTLAHSLTLVDRILLEDIVADNKRRSAGCMMLPLTCFFFVFFAASVMMHEDVTNVHLVESPLRASLVPPLADVHSIPDVWDWLEDLFIPIFFQQEDMFGDPADEDDWSRVFRYNQLQGSVVLEQTRSVKKPCDKDYAGHMTCYPMNELSNERFGRWNATLDYDSSVVEDYEGFEISDVSADDDGRRLREVREEVMRWLPRAGPEEYTFKFFLYQTTPILEIQERIRYLRLRGWLDQQTTVMMVKALILNVEMGQPRLESIRASFMVSRGGGVFAKVRFETLSLLPWGSSLSMLIDAVWFMMLLGFTALTISECCRACRKKKLKKYLSNVSNFISVTNVCMSWFNIFLFLMQNNRRASINSKLEEYNSGASLEMREQLAVDMQIASDTMSLFSSWYRVFITYFNILLMFRCFMALEFQPRLAVVTSTLKATAVDLAHFLIVFVPTFLAYAISGMMIFGRRVDEFGSIDRAVGTCFKIAIENEFKWDSLAAEDFWTTATWTWSYIVVVVLLMLNMVLAIIMDVYTEVRSNSGNSETLLQNIKFLVKRVYYNRRWVPDAELLEVLQGLPLTITDKELKKSIPHITTLQLKRLLDQAKDKARQRLRSNSSKVPAAHMTAAIKVGLDKASSELEQIRAAQLAHKRTAKNRTDKVCVEDIMQSIAVQNHWMASVQSQIASIRSHTGVSTGGQLDDDGMDDLTAVPNTPPATPPG